MFTGSEVARVKGDGIEYADLREYVPGDRLRSINWRASARRDGFVVNEQHPERNTDVVLFVDSFADVRHGGRSTLDDAVRATGTLAARYLERRDRVGLVTFGGILRWLQPGMGPAQRFRLVETLLETGVEPTYTWRDVNVIPARILSPKALILGITPLLDARFVTTIADLRAGGSTSRWSRSTRWRSSTRGRESWARSPTGSGSSTARRSARSSRGSASRSPAGARASSSTLRSRG